MSINLSVWQCHAVQMSVYVYVFWCIFLCTCVSMWFCVCTWIIVFCVFVSVWLFWCIFCLSVSLYSHMCVWACMCHSTCSEVCLRFIVAVMEHSDQSYLGRKGFLQFHNTVHHQRDSRQEVKQERWGLIFRACTACFTYTTQDHLLSDSTAQSRLGSLTYIKN